MNPFDLKALVLAPNAQHPVAVHFPIALFMASYALDALGVWRGLPSLISAARINLWAAALSAPGAIATGLIAWQWKHEGTPLKGNLRLHLIGALVSATLIWTLCLIRRRQEAGPNEPLKGPGRTYFGVGFVSLACIAITAHIGGAVAG